MEMLEVGRSLVFFLAAGLCEIGGGWLVWQWLREGKGSLWGLCGALVLIVYGVPPPFSRLILDESTLPTAACSSDCRCFGAGE